MTDIYPPVVQRPALIALAAVLESRASCLRRDECGDWAINGQHGRVFAIPMGFQIVVMGWTTLGWNRAKQALGKFAKLHQDGQDDGTLIMRRLPSPHEAAVIRHWVGIPKKRQISDEQRAILVERMSVWKAQQEATKSSQDGQDEAGMGEGSQ